MKNMNSSNTQDDFNFDDYFNNEEDIHDVEYQDEGLSDAEYGEYLKRVVSDKINQSGWQKIKDKFRNFKYNGNGDNLQEKSLDDRKKMFVIMTCAGMVFVILAIFFLIKKA